MIRRAGNLIEAFQPAVGDPPRTLAAFFRWALSGAFPMLLVAGLVSAAAGTLEVMSAILLGYIVDAAIGSDPDAFFSANWGLVALVLGFFVIARPLFFGLSSMANTVVILPNLNPLVLTRLHRWTLGQAVTFFDNDFAGRIAQKQMQTARALTDVAGEVINVLFFAIASLIASALLLTSINGWMALALGVWLILYLLMIRWFMPRIRKHSKARANARAMVTGQIVDTITNVKTVKLFAHDAHEETAATEAVRAFRERALDYGVIAAVFRFCLMAVAGMVPVMLIGGTLWFFSQGTASAGDIAAAGAISIRIAQMTGWVSHVLMAIYSNVGEVEDGMNTLTPPRTLTDGANAVTLVADPPTVHFDNITFAYGRKNGGVEAINLDIRAGEKLGIVGASGAGKSTLVSLLLRLYDAEKGRVVVGGENVMDVTQESLRRQIGMVTQETAMFNRSARDNILYGKPDASEDAMIAAARRAEAHEFILQLEDHKGRTGYDAHLGERGVKLSGGQRQRIALARAILKDAPILVLDEATSALDSELEASIQIALDQVMDGKTVLAIAHRLSTIARMDRIVVLEAGRIAEQGTHAELLEANGLYARFWQRQSGGFIGVKEAAE